MGEVGVEFQGVQDEINDASDERCGSSQELQHQCWVGNGRDGLYYAYLFHVNLYLSLLP